MVKYSKKLSTAVDKYVDKMECRYFALNCVLTAFYLWIYNYITLYI